MMIVYELEIMSNIYALLHNYNIIIRIYFPGADLGHFKRISEKRQGGRHEYKRSERTSLSLYRTVSNEDMDRSLWDCQMK